MKNIFAFAASFTAALILFCFAAVLCFGMSSGFGAVSGLFSGRDVGGDKDVDGTAAPNDGTLNSETGGAENIYVIAVYCDFEKDEMFICGLDISPKAGDVTAVPLSFDISIGEKTFKEIYETDGIYRLASEAGEFCGKKQVRFIKFTPETFEKIADRTRGLVYNDDIGHDVLLTGRQAEALFTDDNFAKFCRQMTEKALENGVEKEFRAAVNLCENDFSYPELYRILYE